MQKSTVIDYARYQREHHHLVDKLLAGGSLTAEEKTTLRMGRTDLGEEAAIMVDKLRAYMDYHQIPEGVPSGVTSYWDDGEPFEEMRPTEEYQLVQDYQWAAELFENADWQRLAEHMYIVGERVAFWLNRELLVTGEGVCQGHYNKKLAQHHVRQKAQEIIRAELDKERQAFGAVQSKPGQLVKAVQDRLRKDPDVKKVPLAKTIKGYIRDLFPQELRQGGRPKKLE